MEAKVLPHQSYDDPQPEFEFAPYVCQVLVPTENGLQTSGTGFLVGKDLVLTNYHVVEKYLAKGLQCRFDIKMGKPGVAVSGSTVLVKDIIASSPYSDLEKKGQCGDDPERQPIKSELDYALLKLARAFGEESFEIRRANPVRRGWLNIPSENPEVMPSSKVFILQHPKGSALKSHSGLLSEMQPAETRLRYLVNTEGGSSGSPCFRWGLKNQDGLLPVCLHNYGDPDSHGEGSEFNHGIPLHLIYQDLIAKGIEGLDDRPQFQAAAVSTTQSSYIFPTPTFTDSATQPADLAARVTFSDDFPEILYRLAQNGKSYDTVDVDPYLLGNRLTKKKQELEAFNAQHDSEISRLSSQVDELKSQQKEKKAELTKIERTDEPVAPKEPKKPDSADPEFEALQLVHERWQEEREVHKSELREYHNEQQLKPTLRSDIQEFDYLIKQTVSQQNAVEADHLRAASQWEDQIEEARDSDISDTIFKMLDITESIFFDKKSYCQGFLTLLASQPIVRMLLKKVQNPSLPWQIRKEFEHHTNEMVSYMQLNGADFSEDVLRPVAVVNRTISRNAETLAALNSVLSIDNKSDYEAHSLSLSTTLANPTYQRSDYTALEEGEAIRAKERELLTAKLDTERYLEKLQQTQDSIPLTDLSRATDVIDHGEQLTDRLSKSWTAIESPLKLLQSMWLGINQHAVARTSTLEFSKFNANFLNFANRVFDKPVLDMIDESVTDQLGWRTGEAQISAHPMRRTLNNLTAIEERRESEKLVLEEVVSDVDGIGRLFNEVAARYADSIKRYSLLAGLPGVGAWFHYKLIKRVAKTKELQGGNVPEYDRLFIRAKRFLSSSSVLVSAAYGSILGYFINGYRTGSGAGASLILDAPLFGYTVIALVVPSILAAVIGIGYWIKLLVSGTNS